MLEPQEQDILRETEGELLGEMITIIVSGITLATSIVIMAISPEIWLMVICYLVATIAVMYFVSASIQFVRSRRLIHRLKLLSYENLEQFYEDIEVYKDDNKP